MSDNRISHGDPCPSLRVVDRRDKSVWVHTEPRSSSYDRRRQYDGEQVLPAPGLDFLTISASQIFA